MRKIKYPRHELQILRESTNMSQETLAGLLGCTRSIISKVENYVCDLNISHWRKLNVLKNLAPGGSNFKEDPSTLPIFNNYDLPQKIKDTEASIKALQRQQDDMMAQVPTKTKLLYFYSSLKGKIDVPIEFINLPERLAYVDVNTLVKDIQNIEFEISALEYKLSLMKDVLCKNNSSSSDLASK
jgi:transcriptional regulator with XRE-family HTH domain